jgi:hypothetical protein
VSSAVVSAGHVEVVMIQEQALVRMKQPALEHDCLEIAAVA